MRFAPEFKIEAVVSSDPSRLNLNHVHLDPHRKVLIATNGASLACVPCEPTDEDTLGPVSVDAIKAARRASGRKADVEINANGSLALANGVTMPQ